MSILLSRTYLLSLAILFLSSSVAVFAQSLPSGPVSEYAADIRAEREYLNIRRPFWYRSTINLTDGPWNLPDYQSLRITDSHWSYSLLPNAVFSSFNSSYPRRGNDGPLWQGRGLNAATQAGASAYFRPSQDFMLSIQVAPVLWASENRSFELMPPDGSYDNEYGYIVAGMDYPQRFGEDPLGSFDPGDSEIKVAWGGAYLAATTTAISIGPGVRNQIILSNNAGGVPRIELGYLGEAWNLGRVEFAFWQGILGESDYFDPDYDVDDRYLSGLSLSYRPGFARSITIGVHRIALSNANRNATDAIAELFNPYMSYRLGNDELDQRASITGEWEFDEVGFTVYGEWARNDFSSGYRAIMQYPQRSQAFTLGAHQLFPLRHGTALSLRAEATQLALSTDYIVNGTSGSGFYSHHKVRHGHTSNGQLLGAQIGPGADSQYFGGRWYGDIGMVGAFFQRNSRDKDYIYGSPAGSEVREEFAVNAEMTYAVEGALLVGSNTVLGTELGLSHNIAWNHDPDDNRWGSYATFHAVYSY